MKDLIFKILRLFDCREKIFLFFLIAALAGNAIFELAGIALIMPIIALLSKPVLIQQNKYLRAIHDFMEPGSPENFIIFLALAAIMIYVIKNILSIKLIKSISLLVNRKAAAFTSEMFRNYLYAEYPFHIRNNSSFLHKKLEMVDFTCNGVILALMMVVTDLIVIAVILTMLLFFSPMTTVALLVIFLGVSLLLYLPFKKYNYNLGSSLNMLVQSSARHDLQAFKGIKELMVNNSQEYFCTEYSKLQMQKALVNTECYVFGQYPRFFIETCVVAIGLGTLVVFIFLGMAQGSILLTLTLLAISLIRMMPSMSRIQYNLTIIRHNLHIFNQIYIDLFDLKPSKGQQESEEPLQFSNCIEIENIDFTYPGARKKVIENLSLTIPKNSSVAFVGATGCGKTTLIDILLGLLTPDKGQIRIDGKELNECLHSWQGKIGYVPQNIFLLDSTIRANVAWGIAAGDIDEKRVEEVLKVAQIYDFIKELPDGLDAEVGENGVMLSGGQRQRIGIARALYRNPEVLVLDEATSALDHETENAFVNALDSLKGKLTIIMIAHRLSTVENCDKIVNLENPSTGMAE
jgi:ABC-type multidrug transport system fused ATPase/permease subunit